MVGQMARSKLTLAEIGCFPRLPWTCYSRYLAVKVADTIRSKLTQAFSPQNLEIIDESHLHAGHAGARDGGESHFRVTIVSNAFGGQSRMERQRAVYGVLADELKGPIHALSITAKTPNEQRGEA